jgi:hypothetical protein
VRTRASGLVGAGFGLALTVGMLTAQPSESAPAPAAVATGAPAGVPMPRLSKPPAGLTGHPLWDSWHDLDSFGYREDEYLVSGRARALDGTTAPYTTRIIVTRPKTQARSNGAVLLDWVNVTAQFENAVDTAEGREVLLREGWTFVHVSAQKAGTCCNPLTPQGYDPVRYAALNHPGDQFSADMFSQTARAMKAHQGLDPMKGLKVKRVIAAGQSQSANKLYDYVTQWQASANVIDGFLIHGNGTVKKTFPAKLTVPVLNLLADREAEPAKPTDDRNYRLWEVAGTGHSGYFIGVQQVQGSSQRVAGLPQMDRAGYRALIEDAGNYGQIPDPRLAACVVYGSTMPMHYSVNAALHQLDRWVRTGKRPPRTPRFQFEGAEQALDEFGNPLGGIRLPPIEVPVAEYQSTACNLGGITVPFSDAQIQGLYPTFNRYQRLMKRATNRAVKRGWLLPVDAKDMMRRVCTVRSRYPAALAGTCKASRYDPPRFASKPHGYTRPHAPPG